MPETILVTGGLGYIGSHTVVALIQQGFEVIIADNLSNSEEIILDRIAQIAGKTPLFFKIDVADKDAIASIFQQHHIDLVIHFAAFKSVGESVRDPLKYYSNNLDSLISLLEAMHAARVNRIIFSSSATVYGNPDLVPLTESSPFNKSLSAYASTKQMGEDILEKVAAAGSINCISLRYFNPVGAHSSALIGEFPKGIPNNLVPFVTQTGAGILKQLTVYGNDYDTADGSCIRDYIHVVDLADAHVKACDFLLKIKSASSFDSFNIGTGKGTSVLEIIDVFETEAGVKLNYIIGPRREGDAPVVYADTTKAIELLGWKAKLDLKEMISSAWKWQVKISTSS